MKFLKKKFYRVAYRFMQKITEGYLASISSANVIGKPIINQPTVLAGSGRIYFGKNVNLGYYPSPKYFDGSTYIEARSSEATVSIGDNSVINNNGVIVADKSSITIGNDALIGTNVEILDSDFHNVNNVNRKFTDYDCKPVIIGNNVFIGNNVTILKGVIIGDNSVIGNGSIVTKKIPANVIAAGIPARVIREI